MVCQSLVRDSLITRFNFVDPDCRVLTRLECTIEMLTIRSKMQMGNRYNNLLLFYFEHGEIQ